MNLAVLGFDLLRPGWSAALVAGPLLLLAALWALARRRRERAALVAPRHLARLVPDWSAGRARWRGVLAALAAAFLGLAAVGPVRGYTVRDVERRGLDIVVALDTSRSMLAQDVRPDRLTRAQREVRGLLQQLGGDRAALLGFAGDVRLVAPLTGDRQTLGALVETLSPADNQQGGTNLGGAIERALALFDGRTGAHEAIVLLTDGEDHDGEGLRASELAAERGIRIFVVGVGTEGGGKIPDRHLGFVRDAAGQEVISRLDASTLRLVAERSGGAYLAVGEAPFPLERLYAEHMGRLEGRELWAGKLRIPHDRFQWPLALALVCMASAAGLRERVPGEGRRARAAAPAPAARGAAHTGSLVCLALLAPLVSAAGEGFAARMGEIRRLARAGELEPALERCGDLLGPNGFTRWRAALEPQSFALRAVDLASPLWDFLRWNGWPAEARAEVHFARGVLLLEGERRAEAEEAFQSARGLWPHGGLVLEATYDLGLAALLEGEAWRAQIPELGGQPPVAASPDEEPPDPLEQARAHYLRARAALVERLRLDWRDADTRANVELVQRRLRELDEIERQREEQQDEQSPSEPEEGEGEPEEGSGEESEEGESEQDPGEEPSGEEPPEGEPSDPGEEEPEPDDAPEPPAEEPQSEEETEDGSEAEPAPEPEEALLSREQIQRLLDRLQQLEEQAEALREARRSRQRMPVERDW